MESDLKDAPARRNLHFFKSFVEFPANQCRQAIHRRFERQAALCANDPAVRLLAGDVTYAELNAAANQAARFLLATVETDLRPIALLISQSYDSVLWTLAVLKAGLCYAPLDYRLPEPALRAMITDLGPAALVSGHDQLDVSRKIAANRIPVIPVDADRDHWPRENLDRSVSAGDIASIFYTSGSTGNPKGVADFHANILHNTLRYTNTLKFSREDTLSMVQNPSFSGTASSLFGALLNGAAIAPFDLQTEGLEMLSQWLQRARVTVFHGVPSIFRRLRDPVTRFRDIRLVRLEGDRATTLDIHHYRANFHDQCTLVNGLGATECGLVRQYFIDKDSSFDTSDPIPVGYPVPDMGVRVVDNEGRSVPSSSTGEIVIESEFLSAGYWRDPKTTAARFETFDRGLRRYRSGDLGQIAQDGCLTHLGRVDHRIRIAGEFVDTADIENCLLEIAGIAQVIVRDMVDQEGDRRLCAYLVADGSADLTVNALRGALTAQLPRHLVPTSFVFLHALPLTMDLKVDYQRLPKPGGKRPHLDNDYVAPQTLLERSIERIWSEVFNVDSIGVTDSFFDLGGDSLHAMQVVSRLREKQDLTVELASLFEHSTIRKLADLLEGGQSVKSAASNDTSKAK